MVEKENNLKRLLELDDSIGLFHNNTKDLNSIQFADDVPQDFIDLWKKKSKLDAEFDKRIAELKSL